MQLEKFMADDLIGNRSVVFINKQRTDKILEIQGDEILVLFQVGPSVFSLLQLLVNFFPL